MVSIIATKNQQFYLILIIIPSKRLSSIWPIDRTLTGTTAPNQSRPESNNYEEVFYIPQTPGLKPHHQMQFSVIPRTLNGLM